MRPPTQKKPTPAPQGTPAPNPVTAQPPTTGPLPSAGAGAPVSPGSPGPRGAPLKPAVKAAQQALAGGNPLKKALLAVGVLFSIVVVLLVLLLTNEGKTPEPPPWPVEGGTAPRPDSGGTARRPDSVTSHRPDSGGTARRPDSVVVRPLTSQRLPLKLATASSLHSQGAAVNPMKLIDGRSDTAWCEGEKDTLGIGQYVTVYLQHTSSVTMVRVRNGYQKNTTWDRFDANSRVGRITLKLGGREVSAKLANSWGEFNIPISPPVTTDNVTLVIDSAVRGMRFTDTCLSEISLYGTTGGRATPGKAGRPDPALAPPSRPVPAKTRSVPAKTRSFGAARIRSVTASSTLPQRGPSLAANNLFDGRSKTAWCAEDSDNGVDLHLVVRLSSRETVQAIRLMNGYNKKGTWRTNKRVNQLNITLGGRSRSVTLQDQRGWQTIHLGNVETDRIQLTIKSAHPGSIHNHICLSELEVLTSR